MPEMTKIRLAELAKRFAQHQKSGLTLQEVIALVIWENEHLNFDYTMTPEAFGAQFLYDCGITSLD